MMVAAAVAVVGVVVVVGGGCIDGGGVVAVVVGGGSGGDRGRCAVSASKSLYYVSQPHGRGKLRRELMGETSENASQVLLGTQ